MDKDAISLQIRRFDSNIRRPNWLGTWGKWASSRGRMCVEGVPELSQEAERERSWALIRLSIISQLTRIIFLRDALCD